MKKNGFTIIELLVVISIIAALSTVGFTTYVGIQSKARDSVRKNDLNKLAIALELYFQKPENGKYVPPTGTGTENCDRDTSTFYSAIAPLLSDNNVPKDPKTQANYCYISVNNGQAFRLFAKLENCQTSGGNFCTLSWNYSVYSDNLTLAQVPNDTPLPITTTYTIVSGYSSNQGPVWYYYYYNNYTGLTGQATYGINYLRNWENPPIPCWYVSSTWICIRSNYIVASDQQKALIFWKAPFKGSARVTINQTKQQAGGNGYKFGLQYSSLLGRFPATFIQEISVAYNDTAQKTITATKQMQGNDYLVYYMDSNGLASIDDSNYSISLILTPN